MIAPDLRLLALLLDKYLVTHRITPAERREIFHIAQGFASKDSATADGREVETIRSRRKRLYAKLRVSGSSDLLSRLLALALEILAHGERLEPPPSSPA